MENSAIYINLGVNYKENNFSGVDYKEINLWYKPLSDNDLGRLYRNPDLGRGHSLL